MGVDAEIARVAARQHALITREQGLDAGLTRRMVDRWLDAGRITALRPGVYALAGSPATWEQAVMAAVLAAGHTAAASHAAAARLWRLPCPTIDRIEVTTILEKRVRLQGISAHRSGVIPEADRTTIRGIPITSGARTAVDLSGRLDYDALRRLVDEGLRTGAMSISGLHRCASTLERFAPGRSPQKMRAVLTKIVPGYEPGDSFLETQVYEWIVEAGFPPPVRLHRVRLGGRQYTVDLAYPDEKIAIEVDGYDFHRGRRVFDIGNARRNEFVNNRWRPLHFTSTSTREDVVRDVGRARLQSGRSTTAE
ncbi:MAG: type IV toxin-antitoxin system AbiEi family antitoxin domain-containing protein, partial [Acidimicrobiia bacterium]